MADIKRLYQWHAPADIILLLAKASAMAKENINLTRYDLQSALKLGYEDSIIIYDWLADNNESEPTISNHWIRCGRAYVRNNAFPSLEGMAEMLRIGERRAFLVMQALEKRGIIRITSDFKFERVGRMASFTDLVRQMEPVAKKHGGRCDPRILVRNLYIDPITALRLAQYGEENLGLVWKNRTKDLL